ncbi:hypothetical protein PFICI_09236 [Pestalotiopsis fici W106-1]|uniref:Uncharacterized protein n=1 Tax=Pestalotiopsis fici (strain W106-1 / CGMCC3.15140) TaxID=1229662 RepID=W3WZS5_PESFW|nr:uncharacterized protein PFICI_09236 [Pestalotiopsis fici W106-1]ETS79383.1 hypothetical protein PFICI_09236 [Pestalotiopsis fici W106-1]
MDDDNTDAMAAAMGFSSFGAQPSAKRRKFNSNTDSFIDAPSRNTDHGNGANAMPLGIRSAKSQPSAAAPPPPPQPKQNENEISLEDDEDDPEPQYLDTSRPAASVGTAPTPGDAAIQATIDNIIGSTGAPGPEAHHVGGHGDRHGPRQAGGDRRRGGGQPWWEDYYDPTANMNPWEKLEKQSGLEPLNNDWLSWEESKARWESLQTGTSHQEAASAAA